MDKSKQNQVDPGEKILRMITSEQESEFLLGDVKECYLEILEAKGKLYAGIWYWIQILKSLGVYLWVAINWRIAMLKNYFKITLRNIHRHKSYSIINITGLAVGIACCLLILSWVRYQLTFDRFHTNARQIYRVISEFHSSGGEINFTTTTQAPLAAVLKDNYPEIVNSTRALRWKWKVGREKVSFEENVWFVDPTFLDMFTFSFIQGDPATALSEPKSIVLTETLASKYFRNENPIGKTIIGGQRSAFIVYGVIKDVPQNSHFDMGAIVPIKFTKKAGHNLDEWSGFNYKTYIQLQEGISGKDVERKIKYILKDYLMDTRTIIQLQPLTEVHLYTLGGGGLITYIYIFLTMAVLALLIACMNYMNLSTARATGRAKEVGVRQVVGARQGQLVRQFLSESLFLSLIATAIAVVLALALLPLFQRLAGREIKVSFSLETLLFLVGIAALVGILSGSYPAFVLSNVKPAKMLRGIFRSGRKGVLFRKVLVVTQFALSIFFIFGTLAINRQLHLLQNKNLGYDKENIICLDVMTGIYQNYSAVKNSLLNNPNVVAMAVVDSFLDKPNSSATSDVVRWEGQEAGESIPWLIVKGVDLDFQKTFGIEMAEGRFFSREFPSDPKDSMVVNEAAVRAMNMDSPVGKKFHFWDFDGTIIGVIKDFHLRSLHKNIEPMVMKIGINLQKMAIRIKAEDMTATIEFLETEIKKIVPGYSFEFEFLEEKLGLLYKAEERMENIALAVSFLAIFISCLGLLGLAAFTAEQKTKEIGIRKVLGASIGNIVAMLSKEFIRWVVIANLIAWPVGFYFIGKWLMNFAYRIDISLWIYLVSGTLVLLIALLTVSYQSIKAAIANPVDSLRYE